MSHVLKLLKAFRCAVGAYLLLCVGNGVIWYIRHSVLGGPVDFVIPGGGANLAFLVPVAGFSVIYVPPAGRRYAVIGMSSLLLAIWIWLGILIFNTPHIAHPTS